MSKRMREDPPRLWQDAREAYFNVTPESEPRIIYGTFSSQKDYDTQVVNYIATKHSERAPPVAYNFCEIDVNPGEPVKGFMCTAADHSLNLSLIKFTAVNAPRNISSNMKNNYLWTWDSWDGTITNVPSSTLWSNTMTKLEIQEGFYDSQLAIINGFTNLDPTITFQFDKSLQLMTYTGSKPLILPFSTGFDPAFYRLRPNISVTNTIGSVPSNVVNIESPDVGATVFDSAVNGDNVTLKYFDPAYILDYLASYLGYTSGSMNNTIQIYYGYPQLPELPNSADNSITTPIINRHIAAGGAGSIAIVLYPGAKNGPGNIYGALATMALECPQIHTVIDGDNVLAKIDIAGGLTRSQFHVVGTESWKLLYSGHTNFKKFRFELKDLYQRDYLLNAGPPQITIAVASKPS